MKRPLTITIIGWLFIVSGVVGIIYHAKELKEIFTKSDVVWILIVRLLAIVGGVFAFRGANWARWLLVVWIGFHVILSFYHTPLELVMHGVLMVAISIGLFHRKANAYFKLKNGQ